MSDETTARFRAHALRPATTLAQSARHSIRDHPRTPPALATRTLLLCAALLCGCGIKGPLRQPPAAITPPAVAPAPDAEAAPAAPPANADPSVKPKP